MFNGTAEQFRLKVKADNAAGGDAARQYFFPAALANTSFCLPLCVYLSDAAFGSGGAGKAAFLDDWSAQPVRHGGNIRSAVPPLLSLNPQAGSSEGPPPDPNWAEIDEALRRPRSVPVHFAGPSRWKRRPADGAPGTVVPAGYAVLVEVLGGSNATLGKLADVQSGVDRAKLPPGTFQLGKIGPAGDVTRDEVRGVKAVELDRPDEPGVATKVTAPEPAAPSFTPTALAYLMFVRALYQTAAGPTLVAAERDQCVCSAIDEPKRREWRKAQAEEFFTDPLGRWLQLWIDPKARRITFRITFRFTGPGAGEPFDATLTDWFFDLWSRYNQAAG